MVAIKIFFCAKGFPHQIDGYGYFLHYLNIAFECATIDTPHSIYFL
jgi:hypothetical protein